MLYITFEPEPELRVKGPDRGPGQSPFPDAHQEHDLIAQIGFDFGRKRPAVQETIGIPEPCPVMQQFVAPIRRFVPGQRREPHRQHDVSAPVCGKRNKISGFARELRFRHDFAPVGGILLQIFQPHEPARRIAVISGERHTTVEVGPPSGFHERKTVHPARRDLNSLLFGKPPLRVYLAGPQPGKAHRRECYDDVLSHGYRVFRSLMSFAPTSSPLAMLND